VIKDIIEKATLMMEVISVKLVIFKIVLNVQMLYLAQNVQAHLNLKSAIILV